jgi:hypothetical protein
LPRSVQQLQHCFHGFIEGGLVSSDDRGVAPSASDLALTSSVKASEVHLFTITLGTDIETGLDSVDPIGEVWVGSCGTRKRGQVEHVGKVQLLQLWAAHAGGKISVGGDQSG